MARKNHSVSVEIRVVKKKNNFKNYFQHLLPLSVGLFLILQMVGPVIAQQSNPSVSLEQCRNGSSTSSNHCVSLSGGQGWANGNANAQQSHYVEGYSVPYRAKLENLPTDSTEITLILGYDIKHSNKHAIDYLTHYNRLDDPSHSILFGHAPEVVDPLSGVSGVSATVGVYPIPAPGSLNSPVPGQPTASFNALPSAERAMTLFGGTISNIAYVSEGDLSVSQAETRIAITFTADSATAVLAWGGHIASRLDWGFDGSGEAISAGGINGSPYHMRLIDWNLNNLGNQDRSLSAGAVSSPGNLTVIKHVINDSGTGTKQASDFTITVIGNNPSMTSFPGSEDGTVINLDPGTYSVDEIELEGYTKTLSEGCSGTIESGQMVTCTITNDDVAPTTGTLTVTKVVENKYGGTAVVSDFPLFIDAAQVTSGVANELAAGDYVVSETNQEGYEAVISGDCDEFGNATVVAGQDAYCTITNSDIQPSITVNKEVSGGDAQVSDFDLYVNDAQVFSGVTNFFNAGLYTIREDSLITGYFANFSGGCDSQGNVDLGIGQNLICNILNTFIPPEMGNIVVRKETNPDGDQTQFNFNPSWGQSFQLMDGQSEDSGAIVVGQYSVSEDAVPGWTNTDVSCVSTLGHVETADNIELDAGETVTCTFTNTGIKPTLRIAKNISPSDDGGTFYFFVDGENWNLLHGISPTGDGGVAAGPIEPGTYTITEEGYGTIDANDYIATFGGDCSQDGVITLNYGETKTCNVLNTRKPEADLEIKKNADDVCYDVGETVTYEIEVYNDDDSPNAATNVIVEEIWPDEFLQFVSANTQGKGTYDSNAGIWYVGPLDVDESAILIITAIIIDDPGGTENIYNTVTVSSADIIDPDLDNNSDTEDIAVECPGPLPGDDDGTIIIRKITDVEEDQTIFGFDGDLAGSFSVISEFYDDDVDEGVYVITETAVEGWEFVSVVCDDPTENTSWNDETGAVTIDLTEDETVICTFTNRFIGGGPTTGTLIVQKSVNNDNGRNAVASDFTIHVFNGSQEISGSPFAGSETGTSFTLSPGTYSVSEDSFPDYSFTGFGGDCDSSGSVTLAAGETKTCILNNDDNPSGGGGGGGGGGIIYGSLVVKKVVINDDAGTMTASDFTIHVKASNGTEVSGSPSAGSDTGRNYSLPTGTYIVSEDLLDGYDQISITGDCAADGTVSVSSGVTKTCTITNDDIPGEVLGETIELPEEEEPAEEPAPGQVLAETGFDVKELLLIFSMIVAFSLGLVVLKREEV